MWERGQAIKIISEIEEDTPEFQRASELLNGADRVVVLGFGFAVDNVRRLRFFKEHDKEDRDIIIATGPGRGPIHEKATADWLAKWGLEKNKNHFSIDVNKMFDIHVNPFA